MADFQLDQVHTPQDTLINLSIDSESQHSFLISDVKRVSREANSVIIYFTGCDTLILTIKEEDADGFVAKQVYSILFGSWRNHTLNEEENQEDWSNPSSVSSVEAQEEEEKAASSSSSSEKVSGGGGVGQQLKKLRATFPRRKKINDEGE
jgi:hypothetical protein